MTFLENALKDLDELVPLLNISKATHDRIRQVMVRDADESEHMKTSEFTDQCIDMENLKK